MEFTGELETHLTICLSESKSIEHLRDWGAAHGLKCLHIVLEQGEVISQPMLTRRSTGKLTNEIDGANRLKNLLIADGFSVSRLKIEAAPWNEDVPQSAAELKEHLSQRYFESHIRIICNKDADNSELIEAVKPHSAHLSRNALSCCVEGLEERFVTQRCRTGGYAESWKRLNTLLREIRALGYTVIDVEEEYVVYDSNLEIDAGWIQTKD
jgi:hypothetical protein